MGGGGVNNKKLSMGGAWIFSGTAQHGFYACILHVYIHLFFSILILQDLH